MNHIRDIRRMTREERLAAAEKSDKDRAVRRAQRAKEHAERNAAALKAQQEWAALSPDERASRRRQRQADNMARHRAANAAAVAKAAKGPSENKMLLPAVENKTVVTVMPPAKPREPVPPVPVAVESNATDAAIKLAKRSNIDLASVKGTGAGGRIIVSDVQAKIGQ